MSIIQNKPFCTLPFALFLLTHIPFLPDFLGMLCLLSVFFLFAYPDLFQFFLRVGKFILANEIKMDLDFLRSVRLPAFRRIYYDLVDQSSYHWTGQFFDIFYISGSVL